MMSAALVLFGIIGFERLPVRQFPDVDSPIVSVNTTLRGANPRAIESAVTDPRRGAEHNPGRPHLDQR